MATARAAWSEETAPLRSSRTANELQQATRWRPSVVERGLIMPRAELLRHTVDFSSLRICVTMSVRACVSGACRACVARITLCIISRRALIHSITHARHALVLTHAHGHVNSKRAEINCTVIVAVCPSVRPSVCYKHFSSFAEN